MNVVFTPEQFADLLITMATLNLITVIAGIFLYENFAFGLRALIKKFKERKEKI